jgi:hypothetical protein
MPLNFGKFGAAIALLTVAAFVLWLISTFYSISVRFLSEHLSACNPWPASVLAQTLLRCVALR